MTWTTPKTWASEPLTSIDLNTHVRDNQNYLKDRVDGSDATAQYIRASGDYTTTSTTYVDVDATNMALTITPTVGDVRVTLCGYANVNNTGKDLYLEIDIDGTPYDVMLLTTPGSGNFLNIAFSYVFSGLSLTSHTFKLRWKVQGTSTATLYAGTLLFDVREEMGVA